MYKIAVVGPIPKDTIITHKGEVIEKYGCVTHPVIALSKLLQNEGTVIPIAHIHKGDKEAIEKVFEPYQNINLTGIYNHHNKGTKIELKFIDQNNRLEKQLAKMHPITSADVEPFLDADAFVFVPITDFEVSLDTLKYLKQNSETMIIFDAHGPTTFVNEEGARLRRYWKDRDEWFPYIDVLKMNLEESQCCWIDRPYETFDEASYDENDLDHLDDFANYVLEKGVSVLYITLDSRGALIYSKDGDTVDKQMVASVPVDHVVDTTGCGDSFAGGLAYGFTVYGDIVKAAQYANVLGAMRTQGKTFDVFKNKDETDQIIRETYSSSTGL
ncbi:carbohydrate kinase family protein [Ascidiimonas sp. W6]|uniref:carbohydrate kinase family protein n=1 Tax=Ascidiimonas meishanensis TaxID=3128903 RepID=UPI0030ED3EA7